MAVPGSTQIDSSPNQMLYMLCAASVTVASDQILARHCVRRLRRAASDQMPEVSVETLAIRAPVAQWIEHLTSDCSDECSMRHEGNGHANEQDQML
jgi:hypothetical protein